MAQSKAGTFIGFCIKAGKISLGSNAIGTLRKNVYLLIIDGSAAKNSYRYALKYKNRFNCPLLVCKEGFEDVVHKPFCRLAAISDKNLAEAIINSGDNNYELYTGGSN